MSDKAILSAAITPTTALAGDTVSAEQRLLCGGQPVGAGHSRYAGSVPADLP